MADAGTEYDFSDPEVAEAWERDLMLNTVRRTVLLNPEYKLIGDSPSFMIQRRLKVFDPYEDGGGKGTKAHITLSRNYRQTPKIGNEPVRGSEEGIETEVVDYVINLLRHAGRLNGVRLTQARVPWSVWKEMMREESVYWPQIMEAGMCLHLAGVPIDVSTANEWYLKGDNTAHTLCNTPTAPDADHIFRPNGHADDSTVNTDSTATLDVTTGTKMKQKAGMLPIPVRPCETPWGDNHVFLCHPWSLTYLRNTYSAWWQIMVANLQGGGGGDNPIFTGAKGLVDGVLYVECPYVPPGYVGTTAYRNTRRNIFCGAQSLVLGFAKESPDENSFIAETDDWDYKNNKGLCNGIFLGGIAPKFPIKEQNGVTHDYGKIVVTTYAEELYTSL
jgi:hypothetical protein